MAFYAVRAQGLELLQRQGGVLYTTCVREVLHVRVGIDAGGHIINADEE